MKKRRRRNASDVLAPIVELEGLLLFGGLGLLAYWILSGSAKAFLCPGGGGICSLFPTQTGMSAPLPGPGVGQAAIPRQANSPQPHTMIVMQANANGIGPVTYGSDWEIPGTGNTIGQLQQLGYTDSQIGSLIDAANNAPSDVTPSGGASGSW